MDGPSSCSWPSGALTTHHGSIISAACGPWTRQAWGWESGGSGGKRRKDGGMVSPAISAPLEPHQMALRGHSAMSLLAIPPSGTL